MIYEGALISIIFRVLLFARSPLQIPRRVKQKYSMKLSFRLRNQPLPQPYKICYIWKRSCKNLVILMHYFSLWLLTSTFFCLFPVGWSDSYFIRTSHLTIMKKYARACQNIGGVNVAISKFMTTTSISVK